MKGGKILEAKTISMHIAIFKLIGENLPLLRSELMLTCFFCLILSGNLLLPLSLTAAVKEGNAADKIQEAILKMVDLKTIGNMSVTNVIIKSKLCIIVFYSC